MTSTTSSPVYEVHLPNGDSAEADNIGAILFAARTLLDEAYPYYGMGRLARREVVVTRDGHYDGLVTTMARTGRSH